MTVLSHGFRRVLALTTLVSGTVAAMRNQWRFQLVGPKLGESFG